MKSYYITEKTGHSVTLHPTYHKIESQSFVAYQYLTQNNEVLLFDIENDSIQTLIDLSCFPAYILVGLEGNSHKWDVKSITYNSNSKRGNFSQLTPFKKILCIPMEGNYDVSKWQYLSFFDTQSLPTWSYELAKNTEEHIFCYHRLSLFNLVIKISSVEKLNLQNIIGNFYKLNQFDRDIIVLGSNSYSKMQLLEIAQKQLIPNDLKEQEDFCFLQDYVVAPQNQYIQHPDCEEIAWLSGYLQPTTTKSIEGNYVYHCTNPITKRIVHLFNRYMLRHHYHYSKEGLKVVQLKDGFIHYCHFYSNIPDAKIPILNIITDDFIEPEKSFHSELMERDALIKWKAYCEILGDEELVTFYNYEIHKMKIKENGRYLFIDALKSEMNSRSFDSSILEPITKAGIMDNLFYRKLKINENNVLEMKPIDQQ
jgi:hypothetical protein